MKDDVISRQAAISLAGDLQIHSDEYHMYNQAINNYCTEIMGLPSAQPKYEPVTAKDFAKTMSENTLYGFMTWYGEALELMERQGFMICKKKMDSM